MTSFDDFKLYLPKYLTPESERDLFDGLRQFPDDIQEKFYTTYRSSDPVVYQGDGVKELLVMNLPDSKIAPADSMVISNSCDIDPNNVRLAETRICYTPIINLSKYRNLLVKKWSTDQAKVDNHIIRLKRQEISHIFYLPKGGKLLEDSFVFLDRINNCANSFIDRTKLKAIRLFTLSNLGLYIFYFKLSLHFTRMNERIDRDELIFSI